METKGEAIQAMALHNLSRIDEGLDLITADGEGNVVVFSVSNSQILFRSSVDFSATCLCINTNLRMYFWH